MRDIGRLRHIESILLEFNVRLHTHLLSSFLTKSLASSEMSTQADPVTLGSSAKIAWLQQQQQVLGSAVYRNAGQCVDSLHRIAAGRLVKQLKWLQGFMQAAC